MAYLDSDYALDMLQGRLSNSGASGSVTVLYATSTEWAYSVGSNHVFYFRGLLGLNNVQEFEIRSQFTSDRVLVSGLNLFLPNNEAAFTSLFTNLSGMFSGNDTIDGSNLNDGIRGYTGDDIVFGYEGNDTVQGNEGNDVVFAGNGNDEVNGNQGNDSVGGGAGNDIVGGGKDADVAAGDSGDDTVNGGMGNDTVYGGDGNDIVGGGKQNDLVLGEAGNDAVFGGLGDDTLTGGSGGDVFYVFSDGGIDYITDYNLTEDALAIQSNINNTGITSKEQALAAAIQVQNDVHIALGSNTVVLQGISLGALNADDFVMV